MKDLIRKYVDKIDKYKIIEFSKKNGVLLSVDESNTVDYVLKNRLDELISNTEDILNEYKNNFSVDNFNKIKSLILEYKKRYKDYL